METRFDRILSSLFRRIIKWRVLVVVVFAVATVPAAWFALRVEQDNSINRLMVQTDPDFVALKDFERVFGGGEYVLILAEAPDPFAPAVLAHADRLERALEALPHVTLSSALSTWRRLHNGFDPTPAAAEEFRAFARGTALFARQGLVGPRYLGIPLLLDVHDNATRRALLADIDRAFDPEKRAGAAVVTLRKVGEPYIDGWLDHQTRSSVWLNFALFGAFVVIITLALYRSARTLGAFLVVLGFNCAGTVGFIGAIGGVMTIVSALVPMTILIVSTATLVYLQSRFVERPPDKPVLEHQIFALTNKFVPCTVSTFATAVGFAALAVSKIRPIRELGLWVAAGLVISWLSLFTLLPALQALLKTPTSGERKVAGGWFVALSQRLPRVSYRLRWVLVPAALALCAVGAVALFGLPGVVTPMRLETGALEYIDHRTDLYEDTMRLESMGSGLSLTELWLSSPRMGRVTDSDAMRAFDALQQKLEGDPQLRTVAGPSTVVRLLGYTAGAGDALPADDEQLEKALGRLETLIAREPMLQRFIEKNQLADAHFSVTTSALDFAGHQRLDAALRRYYDEVRATHPALGDFKLRIVGQAPLAAKIGHQLVPTLVQSFALTVAIIFSTFLLLFRNGAARLMAMIPSLFAILVMFAVMRVSAMTLNVATILIASTVLGTSENDQIHFFYHFLERRKDGTIEQSLSHTLLVSGRAIFFATLINAGGFLAFAISGLPPIRQFGLLSSLAFVLSMVADFTALPAALWIAMGGHPDETPPEPALDALSSPA